MGDSENQQKMDITRLVEEYRGKTVEDIFSNHRILRNPMGQFFKIHWEIKDITFHFDLSRTKKRLLENLKVVDYIGKTTEKDLLRKDVKTIDDLKTNLLYGTSAKEIWDLIEKRDYITLNQIKDIYDIDLLFCFELKDLLFLDIETLGLYNNPIIMVGIGYYIDTKFIIFQFLARDLEEEISICEHLRKEIFPAFKCFITYNGKSFDIPYLANRFLYFFDKNPMVYKSEFIEGNISKFHHIDLYHNCRRIYKNQFSKYSLTTIEKNLLACKRTNDLPSNMIASYYQKYLKNPKKYAGLVKIIVEHNFQDIQSMPLILDKLLNSYENLD